MLNLKHAGQKSSRIRGRFEQCVLLLLKPQRGRNLSSVTKPSCSDSFFLFLSCHSHRAEKYIETGREKSERCSFVQSKQTPLQPLQKIWVTIHKNNHHPKSGPRLPKQASLVWGLGMCMDDESWAVGAGPGVPVPGAGRVCVWLWGLSGTGGCALTGSGGWSSQLATELAAPHAVKVRLYLPLGQQSHRVQCEQLVPQISAAETQLRLKVASECTKLGSSQG